MKPTPVVRVSRSMGVCFASHHLHIICILRSMGVCYASHHLHPSFASRVRWGCTVPATTTTHLSRLASDGGVLYQPPPPPVVRVSRSMGVSCTSHHLHLSFASRVRWGCPAPATTSIHLLRLVFDGGGCASHHLHPSFASHVRWGCAVPATTSTCLSRLAFDGGVLSQPPSPPVVRISCSMGVCCTSHHLHPSFPSHQ